jgi:predicted RNA-binding protein with PIN domain
MKHYIIDGNNLLHKIKTLEALMKKDKQAPREKLAFMVERFAGAKKIKISLHFDGFVNIPIKADRIKILYSEKRSADDDIRNEIESAKNRRNLTVVTSDEALKQFAKKCGCESILSEDFAVVIKGKEDSDEESKRIESIDNNEFFKKIFNDRKK